MMPILSCRCSCQTIDILGVMQEKTKGNLDKQEEQLLESILYELRLKYVELNK